MTTKTKPAADAALDVAVSLVECLDDSERSASTFEDAADHACLWIEQQAIGNVDSGTLLRQVAMYFNVDFWDFT